MEMIRVFLSSHESNASNHCTIKDLLSFNRSGVMSRQLQRLKNIVSEIDQIQKQGQNRGQEYLNKSVKSSPEPVQSEPVRSEPSRPEALDIEVCKTAPSQSTVTLLNPVPVPAEVSMELNGSVSIKLKLEDSDEVIQVKKVQDQIEVHFADGKSVRIPLKAA